MFSKQIKDKKKASMYTIDLEDLHSLCEYHGDSDFNSFCDKIVDFAIHRDSDVSYVIEGLKSGKYKYDDFQITSSTSYLPIPVKMLHDNGDAVKHKTALDSTELTAQFYYIVGHCYIDFGTPFCTHCFRYIETTANHDCLHDSCQKHLCSVCMFQTNDGDYFYSHMNSKEHDERLDLFKNVTHGEFLYANSDGFFTREPEKKRSFKLETKYLKERLITMDKSPFLMKGSEKLCSLIEKFMGPTTESLENQNQRLILKMQIIALHSEVNTGYQLCRKPTKYRCIYTIANCLEAVKYYLFRQVDNSDASHYERFQKISRMQDIFETYESDLLTCCSVCNATHKIKAYSNADKLIEVLDDMIERL